MHKYPLPGTIANSILPLGLELTPGQNQEPMTHLFLLLRPVSLPKVLFCIQNPKTFAKIRWKIIRGGKH